MLIPLALEAVWRASRRRAPSQLASRLQTILLLILVVTIAGGLGLLAGGGRPREALHFVYAVVAVGALPIASSLTRRAGPRVQGIASLGAALVILVVIARLSGTG